jgi:hypothetical protein
MAIIKLLINDGFINKDDETYKLTKLGTMAKHLRETHCLVFARLLNADQIYALDAIQLVGLLSCLTNVVVSDDRKDSIPKTTDKQLKSMIDVMGGQVPLLWVSIPAAAAQVKAGKLHALAVSTVKRSPAFPDVPTMQEAGVPDFEVDSWYAMLVPAKTPRAIIDKLNKALNTVLAEPAVRTQLLDQGADAVGGTPEALAKVIAAELPKWMKLAKDANIKAD